MKKSLLILLLICAICVATVMVSGCTTSNAQSSTQVTPQVTLDNSKDTGAPLYPTPGKNNIDRYNDRKF